MLSTDAERNESGMNGVDDDEDSDDQRSKMADPGLSRSRARRQSLELMLAVASSLVATSESYTDICASLVALFMNFLGLEGWSRLIIQIIYVLCTLRAALLVTHETDR